MQRIVSQISDLCTGAGFITSRKNCPRFTQSFALFNKIKNYGLIEIRDTNVPINKGLFFFLLFYF